MAGVPLFRESFHRQQVVCLSFKPFHFIFLLAKFPFSKAAESLSKGLPEMAGFPSRGCAGSFPPGGEWGAEGPPARAAPQAWSPLQ